MEKNKWLEDLIWCPSQIYYYFTDPKTDKNYVIYLRWRWDDPWSAELIEIDECDNWTWPEDWFIEEEFLKDDYKDLEMACINKLRILFPHIQFNEPELD